MLLFENISHSGTINQGPEASLQQMTLSHMDGWDVPEQDRLFSEAMERDRSRLRGFIRRYVADSGEAEDILQDVFFELLEAYRMMKPIEHVTGWLFRVARNRIVDLFRRRRTQSLSDCTVSDGEDPPVALEDLLPSAGDGPDAAYARKVLLEALEDAIEELPAEQREIFVAHEVLGTSFKEYAAETGIGINTLLSRKRYAVQHLRHRLESIYEDFGGGA
ncbi:RNA polymerase sigma factor [Edaphobacter sp. 12200R-103]|jgi:RNA polymerase sigma factor (sigma-70 family)|uniref:RNA polymerase sigma factor n=1 Tax=Edaphobacter sp. 12200R-103 TaxID=2703788 RepID=UPI001EE4609E|nr:RNA polymerase sigma factor [Edaphobacter sp. 12200R-103]